MKSIILFLILTSSVFSYAGFSFPTGMDVTEAAKVVDRFGVGFIGRNPAPLESDPYHVQIHLSWNWIDTKEVSKLGNGADDEMVQYQELHFTQELPFGVEVGLRASLLGFQDDITSFGGFARWGFLRNPYGRLSVKVHGASANYDNKMGINTYGSLLEADFFLKSFIITGGVGPLRSTANFQAQVFSVSGVPVVGSSPEVRVSRRYNHYLLRGTYITGRWNLSLQADQIRDTYNSLLLGYVF